MEYKKPTYEEYCKASEFARVRYKFGVYIQFVAIVLLILLAVYTWVNIEEMKANPINYAEEKLGVVCYTPMSDQQIDFNQNGVRGSIKNIE